MKPVYRLFISFILVISVQLTSNCYAQDNSIVLNGGYIILNGGTATNNIFLVVDQPNPLGIVRSTAGGHINSENQYNFVKWVSGSTIGSYVFPFGIGGTPADYIPFTFDKTVGNNSISTSTWSTDQQNTPHPAATNVGEVTEMLNQTDSVKYAIDRFWDIQATSTTADLTFSYKGDENTTLTPTNKIEAQHWNGSSWDAPVGPGNAGVNTGIGTTGPYTGQTTFSPWVLIIPCEVPTDVTAEADPNPVCEGADLTLKGEATGATSWKWSGPDGYTSTDQNPTITGITTDGAGVYKLTASNACGDATEVSTSSVTVTAGVPTGVTASAAPDPICKGSDLTLTGGATDATSWSWSGPNSYTSSDQSPTITGITTDGAGVYKLTASNACGDATEVSTSSVTVTAGVPTDVTASAAPDPICEGSDLTLTGEATGATTWSWTGPNGYTSSDQNPTITGITADKAGVYKLTASNACGAATEVSTSSVTVNAGAPTDVAASADPNPVCEGSDLTLTGGATDATTWSWTGPDGYTSSDQNPTITGITADKAGVYKLTASNDCGAATEVSTSSVTVNQPANGTDIQTACESFTWVNGDGNTYTSDNNTATFTIVGGAENGCDSIVTLDLTINQPANGTDVQTACGSFTWTNGDGNTYTSDNNTATFTIDGGAENGCDSIVTLDLTINQPANSTDVQTACESFTWVNGDGNTYTSDNNTATFTIVGGAANGCDSIVTLDLTINQPATGTDTQTACGSFDWIDGNTYTADNNTATFTIVGGAENGCDSIVTLDLTINQPVTGTDVQTACGSFNWIDGNTYTSDNNTATHTIAGGAESGCDSIVTLNLTIESAPTINATSNGPICEAGLIKLDVTEITGATYEWTGPNGFTSQDQSPIINNTNGSNTGTYEVTVSLGSNCSSTSQVDVTVYPLPVLDITTIDDDCSSNVGEIIVDATSLNTPLTYAWSNGSTDSTITGLSEGTYEVTVTDATSCSITSSIHVGNSKANCKCFVYVPNAFSPNGDGNNDLLFVRGDCVSSLTFKVFNQWGNLVFQTNKINDGWNGMYKGEAQNTAVFVYTLKATLENGEKVDESGDISLIR